jgi:hypothetical protein
VGSDLAKFEDDFNFVKDHISDFFDRGSVRRILELIDDVGITGWEKWWQVEFAAWLAEHDGIGDWSMEEVFLTDLRHRPTKDSIAIDIGFRLKGFSTKEMLFLELKQNIEWKRCMENMLVDAKKVELAQSVSIDGGVRIRNFFVVGIYPTGDTSKAEVHDYVEKRAEQLDISMERQYIFTKFIQSTPFSVTMF